MWTAYIWGPFRSRFISSSGRCSAAILSEHIASALTAVKDHVIKYSEAAFGDGDVNHFWSIGGSSEVVEELRLRDFRGSRESSFFSSTLCISLPHGLVGARVLSLVNWCFGGESGTYLCASGGAGCFWRQGVWLVWVLDLHWVVWGFCCPRGGSVFAVWRHGLSADGGDSCGRGLCSARGGFVFVLLWGGVVSDLHGSRQCGLVGMFGGASRYLDDIFIIDNPEFERHIPDIYLTELQLHIASTSDKETSFLDLDIEVIGSGVRASVCNKRDVFGFPIVNFPWLSGDVPRLPSYGVYISQLVRFARCCTSVSDFNYKTSQLASKLLAQGCRCRRLRETFGSSGHSLTCNLNLVKYRFKNMLRKESLTRFSTVI